MNEEFWTRIRRLYAALDSLTEFDISLLKAQVFESSGSWGVFQDFSGGMGPEQLTNVMQSAIYNVAHLKDPLKRYAERNGKPVSDVEATVDESEGLQIVVDLSNWDKHGELRRSRSGKSPYLTNINRVLRLVAQPGRGVGLTLNRDGTPRVVGSGSASAVIVADVIDSGGAKLGEVETFLNAALAAWESLLSKWELDLMLVQR